MNTSDTVIPLGSRTLLLTNPVLAGGDVLWVQRYLASSLGITLDLDGVYGAKETEPAVRAWQKAKGLTVDGIFGMKQAWPFALQDAARPTLPSTPAISGGPIILPPGFIARAFPHAMSTPEAWTAGFEAAFTRIPVFNKKGAACVFAKANTEAKHLTRLDEDLYYTTLDALGIFGSRVGPNPSSLLRNPVALGNQVYGPLGGYPARGYGLIQLTGLANQTAFAKFVGMSLDDARKYMLTIPGAALTAPWYIWHFGAAKAANQGDMRAVLACVAGKHPDDMDGIWKRIGGDKQMADYSAFASMLGA